MDQLLRQSGTFRDNEHVSERVMDSGDIERERGITILAKNTAVHYNDVKINIVDTPGHADFGGEVERVLSMVDCVLLVVDSIDGPMPQTRFVTQKAFQAGLNPIVVVNKIDRPGARPDWVIDQIFDLFDNLGGTDEQLDFPIVYTSALNGIAGMDPSEMTENMDPLFQAIVDNVQPPEVDVDGPFQMQISALDYNNFLGVIGVGRITRGSVSTNTPVTGIMIGMELFGGETPVYPATACILAYVFSGSRGIYSPSTVQPEERAPLRLLLDAMLRPGLMEEADRFGTGEDLHAGVG